MSTRYQTYQTSYGWITVDTKSENPPETYISGPFDVTLAEVDDIKSAASIELNEDGTEVIVIPDGSAG